MSKGWGVHIAAVSLAVLHRFQNGGGKNGSGSLPVSKASEVAMGFLEYQVSVGSWRTTK